MKFIDLFAGIGGFRKGMEMAGHECVGFCEFDKFATASYTSMHLITEEQREFLNKMPLKQRQKEILKEEYRNGEWYANDIRRVHAEGIPKADCWCFGFPCQDISVAGKQLGFQGNRSSLFFRVMYLIGQLEEEDKPIYLFIENVKNLLSVNGGWDFARLLVEMEQYGYDAEWQVLNSKDFGVPQNRERVFIIGHLRGRSTAEVFTIEGTDGENSVHLILDGCIDGRNSQRDRIYSKNGLCPTIATKPGGNTEPKVAIPCFIDLSYKKSKLTDAARCLQSRYAKSPSTHEAETSGVDIKIIGDGRRFKEDGEPMFTLTGQDRHGVGVAVEVVQAECSENETGIYVKFPNGVICYAVWYEKYQCYIAIRKLTPKECFRLQGWTDDYFEKAEFVNSDSQLYKQAGNGVTVNVIYEIAKRLKECDKD